MSSSCAILASRVFVLLSVVPFALCESIDGAPERTRAVEEVSLVQLIATPDRFAGKRVIVIGVYKLDFESFALYLTKDDATLAIRSNSVALGIFQKGLNETKTKQEWTSLNGSHVRVVGTFRHAPSGHMNLWRSELTDISAINPVGK
jgi:hypothetical protein